MDVEASQRELEGLREAMSVEQDLAASLKGTVQQEMEQVGGKANEAVHEANQSVLAVKVLHRASARPKAMAQ